jgi:two-component system, chemotaxis family, chemotaxis protein CheY
MRQDLIVMDLKMPDMDRLAVMERLRVEPQLAAVPVIMITNSARDTGLDSVAQALLLSR